MIKGKRSATPTLFGLDFQTNAAIVLMLENMQELKTIRMEGFEDIEIGLNDGSYILAQAKSIVNSSTDFSNVLRNLKHAIESLSDSGCECPSVKKYIYITNSPNPFSEKHLNSIFYGMAQRDFYSLPQALRDKMTHITSMLSYPLDVSKFRVQVLPFETDNDKERYKCVIQSIGEFLSSMPTPFISKDLHRIWKDDIFKSGTRKNQEINLTKNDIVWPIIVIVMNNSNNDDLDDSQYEEVKRLYGNIIDSSSENFEFVTKVLYKFNEFRKDLKGKERVQSFVEQFYYDYYYLLEGEDITISDEIKELLLKIILSNILNKRIQIDNIKKAVNL